MSGYWPWWLGGLALGSVAIVYYRLHGQLLGVSGTFANVLRRPADDLAGGDDAALASSEPSVGAPVAARPRARLTWSAHATLLLAIAVGGAIGALSRGTFGLRLDLGPEHLRLIGSGWRSSAALAVGGLLVGFGTAMAGGCTSGHGLCGTSRLQRGSLAATASFFGAAILISLLLDRVAP
jgi:uncharacterized membrane protein YedE/YeeE